MQMAPTNATSGGRNDDEFLQARINQREKDVQGLQTVSNMTNMSLNSVREQNSALQTKISTLDSQYE